MYHMHYLYYINGRLASNEDLKYMFSLERKYGELAHKEEYYTRLNVKVIKYRTPIHW
jgi:hypothetical protein